MIVIACERRREGWRFDSRVDYVIDCKEGYGSSGGCGLEVHLPTRLRWR